MLVFDIKKYLEDTIENNSDYIEQCDIDREEHPNSKFNYREYYKAKNEVEYAEKLLSLINKRIDSAYIKILKDLKNE